MYQVIDIRTGECVGVYSTLKRAMRRADQLDLEYGAVRYVVRREPGTPVYERRAEQRMEDCYGGFTD